MDTISGNSRAPACTPLDAGRVGLLRVHCPLDREALPVVHDQIEQFLKAGRRFLLFDLRETSFADSDALRFLAAVQERLRARGGQLTLLVSERSSIAPALQLLRWERLLPWCSSARQAWRLGTRIAPA